MHRAEGKVRERNSQRGSSAGGALRRCERLAMGIREGVPVAPRTAKHAPHMTAGEPDHVIFPTRPTLTFTRVPSASAGPRFSPFRGDRSPAGGAHRHPAWCMEAPNDCSTKYGMKRTLFPWYVLRVPRQRVPTTFFRVLHFSSRHTREHCGTSQSAATAAAF